MKKRLGIILGLSLLVVLLTSSLGFAAGGLELTSSSPKEGSKSSVINNVAIKLYFNEDVTSKEAQKANEDCFKITGPKGKEVPYHTLYNSKKYPDQVWIQLETDLEQDTNYKVTVSKDFIASNGDELGKDEVIKFRTRNTKQDNSIYMIMMVVMFGGMFFFSSWDMKRQAKKQQAEETDVTINPYKIAKEKGISYEEALVVAQKEKERLEKKRKKQEEQERALLAALEEDGGEGEDRYFVARKRPISAVGGKGISRRKKTEAQEIKRGPNQSQQKKGQSKGQKKKHKK